MRGRLIRGGARAGMTRRAGGAKGRDRSATPPKQGLFTAGESLSPAQACGFDLPFVLVPLDERADKELGDSLLLPPSERVKRMLEELGAKRARRKG